VLRNAAATSGNSHHCCKARKAIKSQQQQKTQIKIVQPLPLHHTEGGLPLRQLLLAFISTNNIIIHIAS
jgi:hypothetical protein